MLAKRALSAVVILLIAGFLIFFGSWTYAFGAAIILSMATWEFNNMFTQGGHQPNALLLAFITLGLIILRNFRDPYFFSFGLILTFIIICVRNIWTYKEKTDNAAIDLVIELSSIVFVIIPGSYLINLRAMQHGLFWILLCVLAASLADVSAYLFGSAFGRHKLSPKISPNKTIEGYISGIFAAGLAGLAMGLFYPMDRPDVSILMLVLFTGIVAIVTPLGDLAKSIIKRSFSLKDTGNLIPGHGGMLDRLDTILWAAPILFFLIHFLA